MDEEKKPVKNLVSITDEELDELAEREMEAVKEIVIKIQEQIKKESDRHGEVGIPGMFLYNVLWKSIAVFIDMLVSDNPHMKNEAEKMRAKIGMNIMLRSDGKLNRDVDGGDIGASVISGNTIAEVMAKAKVKMEQIEKEYNEKHL